MKPLNAAETTWDRSVNALPSSAPFSALEPIDSPFSNALLTAAASCAARCDGQDSDGYQGARRRLHRAARDTWKLPSCRAPIRAEHGCVTSQPRRRRKSPPTTAAARRPSADRCHRAICRERHRLESSNRATRWWRRCRSGATSKRSSASPTSQPRTLLFATIELARFLVGLRARAEDATVEATIANLAAILDKTCGRGLPAVRGLTAISVCHTRARS